MAEPRARPELRIPDPGRTGLAGAVVVVLAFAAFGVWAALAPLSGAIIAPGTVKVDNNRKTLQHLEGGIIKDIRVRDGARVKAGDVLIVLQDTAVDASVDLLSGQLYAEMAKVARLTAEREERSSVRFPPQLLALRAKANVAEIMQGEEHLFSVRRVALEDQVRALRAQIEEAKREVAGLNEQIESETRALDYLKEEVSVNESLYNEKFINKTRLLGLKRELAQTEALRSEHVADLAQAKQKIGELDLRILNLRVQRVQSAADELEASQRRVYDLQERLRPSQDAATRQQVVAPVDGEVVDLRVHTIGGVVAPREALLDLVPDEKALIIEARVGVDDIDEVQRGMRADVRLSAYSQRDTPLAHGEVVYVSADRMVDEATRVPYYVCHVKVDAIAPGVSGSVPLYPGMPAEVFVRTRDRTTLEYLLEPITNTLRRAGRET